ncbi:MAG TPA: TfoX/Sxy family protein [Polyangiaceae bacterium]|jgi:TfoX/Sxy family transcriptional regulator of competence genes
MSYDENLARRVRSLLADRDDVAEKKMFGGLCFMVAGAMCCGLTKTDFMVRVGPAQYDDALAEPHARPMDFTGRPMAGMVYVAPEGLRRDAALAKWIARGVRFVTTLPAKKAKRAASKALARPTANDRRMAALLDAFRSVKALAPIVEAFEGVKPSGRKFGSNGLKVNGKLFALFTQGTLVVKLPRERVAALVASRVGTPFDPGHGRLMKEWLAVTSAKASWVELAKEAHAFVRRG